MGFDLIQDNNEQAVYAIQYELKDEFPELTGEIVHHQESKHQELTN